MGGERLISSASIHLTNILDHLLDGMGCLSIGDKVVNKNPCPHGDYILVEGDDKK